MKVTDIERIVVDVPFTARQQRITQRTVYNWSILELCRVTADTGDVGWGETVIHYTHQRVTDASVERVLHTSPAEAMWDDSIGAGLQMALFDLVGKITGVAAHQLLGTKVRAATPISWWCSHASPEDWTAEAVDAVAAGYTSLKNKPRPWWDIYAQVEAVSAATPPYFKLDLDPNGSLQNAATAVPVLTRLARYECVAMFETPIPQKDILGNRQIRRAVPRPLAMHFGNPPFVTAIREEVCDGFVVNGGASRVLKHGTLAAEAVLPFWLQLVGNGLTTRWAAHLGAVLSHATWPTISCINLYSEHLLKTPVEVIGPITMRLWAASSAQDTDFVVRLADVRPDGFTMELSHGIVRARYRESFERPTLIERDKPYEYTIQLNPTANLFRPGHRIRVEVTSSDFPNFDRNHNTGGDDYSESTLQTARQTIFHDGARPSRIILPVVT